jgi:outer membrane protein TolC
MEAATADYQASQEDFNNVLIMIRAEVAGTYLLSATLSRYNQAQWRKHDRRR